MSRYLDAALLKPHEPVQNFGSTFLFAAPTKMAKAQVDRALQCEPTMVVAVDFLFWFCYGDASSEEQRLVRFRDGLQLLESVTCPLVLGDIPDASAATNKVLRPRQIPQPGTIVAANKVLNTWASNRTNTTVIGLAEWMEAVRKKRPIGIRTKQWSTEQLLQPDGLHPTARGAALLALKVLEHASAAHGRGSEHDIQWDLNAVYMRGLQEGHGESRPQILNHE